MFAGLNFRELQIYPIFTDFIFTHDRVIHILYTIDLNYYNDKVLMVSTEEMSAYAQKVRA